MEIPDSMVCLARTKTQVPFAERAFSLEPEPMKILSTALSPFLNLLLSIKTQEVDQ